MRSKVFLKIHNIGAVAIVFGLALLCILWISLYFKVQSEKQLEINNVRKDTANLARAFEEHTLRTIKSADQTALFLKYQYEQEGRALKIPRYVREGRFAGTPFVLLSVADETGDLVDSSQVPFVSSNIKDREHFLIHKDVDSGQLFISKTVLGRSSGKWSIQLTRRINKPDGSFGGVVIVSVDPSYFSEFYKQVDLGENSLIAMVGRDSIVRARQSGETADIGQDLTQSVLTKKLATHSSGFYWARSPIDGIARYFSYRALRDYPLTVLVGVDEAVAMRDFNQRSDDYFLLAGQVSFMILAFILLLLRLDARQKVAEAKFKQARDTLEFQVADRTKDLSAANEKLEVFNQNLAEEIEDRKRMEAALASSVSQLRTLVETIPDLVWLKNAEGVFLTCNPMFERLLGAREAEIVGKTDYDFVDKELADFFRENDRKAMAAGKPSVNEEWLTFANDGHKALVETVKAPMVDAGGTLIGVLGISRDITERVRREQAEYYQATHDELTGLYNRRGFAEGMAKKLPAAGGGGALLLVGIDDFKLINDVYGLEAGDKYLAALGQYLLKNFREAALVARFDGDEFMLFFPGPDGLSAATRSSALMEVIWLETESGSFFVQLSGGIALLAEQENNLDLHIQRAHLALHHAKESGKWCCKTYEPILQDKVSRRYEIREALNHALSNEEFRLVFQPIFDIQATTAKIVGFETLLRWTSRLLGEVSPAEFIPVAEETNLILPIGKWVLREACRFSVNIGKTQGEFVNVAVNISMLQLAMPNFVSLVKDTLQETGLPARNLTLEVTESILMTDAATRISYLQELRDFGVAISLDDFGTGYSSFTYLAQMPITTLKIDKSMVDEVMDGVDTRSMLLLESLLKMSALLGYKVVAEGVETQEQLIFLKSKGCGYGQGYLLGRPMPEAAVLAMVGARQASVEGMR